MSHRRMRFTIICSSLLLAAVAFFVPSALAQVAGSSLLLDGSFGDSRNGDPAVRSIDFPAGRIPLDRISSFFGGGGSGSRAARAAVPLPFRQGFALAGSLPEGDTATAAAFSPDGAWIILAHRDSRNLVIFDADTRVFVKDIPLSGAPNGLAVSADGSVAVTANVYEDTASIVDLSAGVEIAVVPVGDQPGVVRITPDSATAVVGNTVESTLSVIDIASATELRRIPNAGFVAMVSVNFEPGAIAVAFSQFELAGNTLVVHPDYYNNRIQIFDIGTGATTTLASDANPRGVAVTPDGSKAAVAHTMSVQKVSVIDVASKTISKTIPTLTNLDGPIAIRPDGAKAVVAVQNNCRVVNLVTNAVSGDLATASVNELYTTASGLYCLCIGFRGSLIDYASETLLKNLNEFVSTSVGAVSPVDPRGVMVATTFGEDMVVVNTNGAGGYMEGHGPSGPPPEGDKARTVALSPDGTRAVAANIFSDNASIIDLATLAVEAIVDVGDRPAEVAITPDSAQAVVADGDGVWRINLDTLSVEGAKLATGDMGSISFLFSQTSGMTLSHDGQTLVTCGSFTDNISIIDTASWAVVKTLAIGDFPVRAIFSADDSTIYVTNRDDDTLKVVNNAGSGSTVTGSIPVGDWPFEMALAPDEETLYLLNYNAKTVGVVDLPGLAMTATIPLPNSPAGIHLDRRGGTLFVPTGTWSVTIGPGPKFSIAMDGELAVLDALSAQPSFTVATGLPPAMLAFGALDLVAAIPSPFGDGITLIWPPFAAPVPR